MAGTASQVYVDGTPTNGANPWIDSLVWGGAWADTAGLATTGGPVTISFAAVSGGDPYYVLSGPSMTWSTAGLNALGLALQAWESVASIDFVEAAYTAADVWLWQGTDAAAEGALGWSEVPAYSSGEPLYVVFNGQDSSWSTSGLALGGYGYITLVHELGHLLGLAHPHDGGDAGDWSVFPGVSSPFGDYGDYNLNQGIFTVMSYNDGWGSQFPSHGSLGYGWEATPMALDIAAIQAIYGANTTYAQGSNTYTLPSYNGAGTYWSCIWDTGGTDLITNAGSSIGCIINLTAAPLTGPNAGGYVSYAAGIVGGFTIANGVVIENATGGSGNDTITGNSAANTLTGGSGNDSLTGGTGNDTISGGDGTDTAVFSVTLAGATITYNSGTGQFTIQSADGTDSLSQVEYFQFSNTTVASSSYMVTDTTAPTVTITDNISGTATGNITYSLVFSEAVTGLTASDFTVTNGTVTSVSGSGANYSVVVQPTAGSQGNVGLTLAAGAVTDAAGNANGATSASSQPFDTQGPTVSITDDTPGTATAAITYALVFSESVTGLSAGDFAVTNGSVTSVSGSGTTYSVVVQPSASAQGNVTLTLLAGAVTDAAGNANGATSASSQPFDTRAPTVTITDNVSGTATGNITYTLVFSESVTGLTSGDFTVTNGTVTSVTGSGTTYSVIVQPTAGSQGNVVLTLNAGAVTDAVANANAEAAAASQAYDTLAPTVTITDDIDGTATGTVTYTLAFSENVTGLTASDFSVTNGTVSTITGSGANYTVTVAPSAGVEGTLSLSLNAGAVVDAAGNGNAQADADDQSIAIGLIVNGTAGADSLVGSSLGDTLLGGLGNDTLVGGAGDDVLTGGLGVDFASYAAADEDLVLSLADATLSSSAFGSDTFSGIEGLIGGQGNDSLTGDALANLLYGGDGDDTLEGGAGNDVLRGDAGTDTASYATATAGVTVNLALTTAQLTVGAGTDTLTLIENLTGSDYADTLTGNALANVLDGGAGNDVLTGGAGADTLLGGDGNDRFMVTLAGDLGLDEVITGGEGVDELRFAAAVASTLTLTAGVEVDSVVIGTGTLAAAVTTGTVALNVNAAAAANGLSITGNAGANQLTGSDYDDTLLGGLGNDTLVGGQGDDTLTGGLGVDQLTGGLGADVFVFNALPNAITNRDVITDYSVADDRIHLENAVMAGLGLTTGTLGAAAFASGNFTSAQDASDRIIYNSVTGMLYYDPDGLGGLAAISFAQLGAGLDLTNDDFEII